MAEGSQVANIVLAYKRESERARETRMRKNRANREAFMSLQDWSHKKEGQSREFLPKVAVAAERFSAFVKRSLIQFGDWFTVDMRGGSILDGDDVRSILKYYLSHLPEEGDSKEVDVSVRIGDAVKAGSLDSLIVLKVYGRPVEKKRFALSGQRVRRKKVKQWRLFIDLVRAEDYHRDPTGNGLYEIQVMERDLYQIKKQTTDNGGPYDPEVVEMLEADMDRLDPQERDEQERGHDETHDNKHRKRVELLECWGTLLDEQGEVLHENAVTTIANDRFVIREPESNPFWHGESPFIAEPIIRVPDSVWHRALYDDATSLNFSINELFNLMLDGGLASVHGIKQIRLDALEDPSQASSGIMQGDTLAVTSELPFGEQAVETVATGEVPNDAMNMFQVVEREFNTSALTNEIQMGFLPPKAVKATEVVEAEQNSAVTMDAIAADLENAVLVQVLRKSWLTILQSASELDAEEIVRAIGPRKALILARMSPAERFVSMGQNSSIKVHGLSATVARSRDFQKLMALMQSIVGNPVLLQAGVRRISADKIITQMLKMLGVNPEHIEKDEIEAQRLQKDMQELPFFMDLVGGGARQASEGASRGGSGLGSEDAGEPNFPAEVNQQSRPSEI